MLGPALLVTTYHLGFVVKMLWTYHFSFGKDLLEYLSLGVYKSCLGLIQNRPDLVGLQDSRPATSREKPQVESDRARVNSGQIRLRPKDKDQRPNLVQISQI